MELATINLPAKEQEIERVIKEYDHPMMIVLKAIAAGKTVIDIQETFRRAGRNSQGLPKLAFSNKMKCRYDLTYERNHRFVGSDVVLTFPYTVMRLGPFNKHRALKGSFHSACPPAPKSVIAEKAINDLFCWEVNHWDYHAPLPEHGDPVLLRKIRGVYYEVIAQWDLTELEKALFSGILPAD